MGQGTIYNTQEASARCGVTLGQMARLCRDKRLKGARRDGFGKWKIPALAVEYYRTQQERRANRLKPKAPDSNQ